MIGKTFFHTVLIHCLLFSAVFGCLSEKKPRFLVTSPDSGNTAYGYDNAGNMTSSTDANNITVTYDYDALSRLTDINFPDSSQDISCGYDSGIYGIGKLTSVSDPAGSTSFDYNALGQITQETRTADSLAFDTVYGYDTVTTDLNALTYPSGLALTYQRDGNGRISGISADGQSIIPKLSGFFQINRLNVR